MAEEQGSKRPDLTEGVPASALDGGKLLGHVGDKNVLMLRAGGDLFAD